eukprot:TRINITY_DN122808_c0_g1_i1.p1 TRINITY_DN122808_c0_g1~~TRINITY_DN122808_c0_g1_i1.p1  ORF type:complete len:225 (-),score=50.04 TRINITY_DN122808_c0_g1_i1:110-784(-)
MVLAHRQQPAVLSMSFAAGPASASCKQWKSRPAAVFCVASAAVFVALHGSAALRARGWLSFGDTAGLRHRREAATALSAMVGEPEFRPAYVKNPAPRMGPDAARGEVVPGLQMWLEHMGLGDYLQEANDWCDDSGAAVMVEVLENLDDMVDEMGLPEMESDTLRKRGRVSYSSLEQRGELVSQEVVKPARDLEGTFTGYMVDPRVLTGKKPEKDVMQPRRDGVR